jgi:hypothetical protein
MKLIRAEEKLNESKESKHKIKISMSKLKPLSVERVFAVQTESVTLRDCCW